MTRNIVLALALIAAPGMAIAGGCFGEHAYSAQTTVAEVEPQITPIPAVEGDTTMVASLTDCTTSTGDALVQCLAAQNTN